MDWYEAYSDVCKRYENADREALLRAITGYYIDASEATDKIYEIKDILGFFDE